MILHPSLYQIFNTHLCVLCESCSAGLVNLTKEKLLNRRSCLEKGKRGEKNGKL